MTVTAIMVDADLIGRHARDAFADDCTLISDGLDDERGILDGWRDVAEEHAVLIDREHMLQYDIDMEVLKGQP